MKKIAAIEKFGSPGPSRKVKVEEDFGNGIEEFSSSLEYSDIMLSGEPEGFEVDTASVDLSFGLELDVAKIGILGVIFFPKKLTLKIREYREDEDGNQVDDGSEVKEIEVSDFSKTKYDTRKYGDQYVLTGMGINFNKSLEDASKWEIEFELGSSPNY
jgi:hypothetical protein